ncbi:MAG TPA: ATP synthase F0 subunit B [Blastocatellia bacterium]|nr:ATP synthase F0 subunit B [Blastocatellia bacterium]
MVATAIFALEGGGNLISPDGSLVFVFILFIIFVFVINRLLFKPVGHVLDQRESLTEGSRHEARAALRLYDAKAMEYAAALRQARAESYRFLEQQRAHAIEERTQLLDQARQKAAGEIQLAKTELLRQAADARVSLETEALEIAAEIARSVLGRAVQGGAD